MESVNPEEQVEIFYGLLKSEPILENVYVTVDMVSIGSRLNPKVQEVFEKI